MNTKLVVVLAVVLLAALVVDAASTKDRKNNKGDKGGKKDNKGGNKDNKKGGKDNKNVCLPVEGALKKAGFELCKLKLDKVEAMLERADELECFDWLVEEAMDKMREMIGWFWRLPLLSFSFTYLSVMWLCFLIHVLCAPALHCYCCSLLHDTWRSMRNSFKDHCKLLLCMRNSLCLLHLQGILYLATVVRTVFYFFV